MNSFTLSTDLPKKISFFPKSFFSEAVGFWCLAGALLLSHCTIEGPAKIVVLKEGEILIHHGDTIYSVAKKYQVPVRALMECNGLHPPYLLKPYQKLKLPLDRMESPKESHREIHAGPQLLEEGKEVQWEEISRPPPQQVSPIVPDPGLIEESKKEDLSPLERVAEKSVPSRRGGFLPPVEEEVVRRFGEKDGRKTSEALCFKATPGTKVNPSAPGIVLFAGDLDSRSELLILIQHPDCDGLVTVYGPFEKLYVAKGQKVNRKTCLGKPKGSELYFRMFKNRKLVDPAPYLK